MEIKCFEFETGVMEPEDMFDYGLSSMHLCRPLPVLDQAAMDALEEQGWEYMTNAMSEFDAFRIPDTCGWQRTYEVLILGATVCKGLPAGTASRARSLWRRPRDIDPMSS